MNIYVKTTLQFTGLIALCYVMWLGFMFYVEHLVQYTPYMIGIIGAVFLWMMILIDNKEKRDESINQ